MPTVTEARIPEDDEGPTVPPAEPPPAMDAESMLIVRGVALFLAVLSHPQSSGAQNDDCFPARARRFERYLLEGS